MLNVFFHHIHVVLVGVTTPVTLTYLACSVSILAILRAIKLCPRREGEVEDDVDLSGRIIIVTGSNTGESRHTSNARQQQGIDVAASVLMAKSPPCRAGVLRYRCR